MATLVVSVSAISLRLLPFYERGFTWWAKGASLLLSDSFDVPRLRLQLNFALSFPNFEQPRLSIQMAVGALLATIYLLASAGEWLLWKYAQQLRASETTPGLIERAFMGLLSVSSWLIFRWPMELLQALLDNSGTSWKDTVDVTENCISCKSSTLEAPAPVTRAAASCLLGSAALGGCVPVYLLTTTTPKAKWFGGDTGDVDITNYTDKEDAMAVDKIFCLDNYLVAKLAFVVISSRCPWVVVVDFSGCPNLEGDLVVIKNMTKLQVFRASGCKLLEGSFESFLGLSNLKIIDVSSTKIDCKGALELLSAKPLAAQLKELSMGNTNADSDISAFKGFNNLSKTNVRRTNCFGNLLLAGLPKLTSGNFSFTKCSGDVEAILAKLANLKEVFLYSTDCSGNLQNFEDTLQCRVKKKKAKSMVKYETPHATDLGGKLLQLCGDDVFSSVQRLIYAGANLNVLSEVGESALHYAAEIGSADMVKVLVDGKANLDLVDKNGRSALFGAALGGFAEVVKVLVDAKVSLDLVDNDDKSALHWAAEKGFAEVVKVLADGKANLDLVNEDGKSALHLAAQYNKADAVKMLVDEKADLNLVDKYGASALQYATEGGLIGESFDRVVKLLVDTKANPALPQHHNTGTRHMEMAMLKMGMDPDGDGKFTEFDFIKFMMTTAGMDEDNVDSLRRRFQEMDADGSGYLLREDVLLVLASANRNPDGNGVIAAEFE